MNPQARHVSIPAWKMVALLVSMAAAVVGGIIFWIDSIAARRWAEAERKVNELHAVTLAKDMSRPPLYGESRPGNGWEDYSPALSMVESAALSDEFTTFWDLRGNSVEWNLGETSIGAKARPSVIQLTQEHLGAFRLLHEGAHRAEAHYLYVWKPVYAPFIRIQGPPHSDKLIRLALSRAILLEEQGNLQEATEILLDVCQFGRDLGQNAPLHVADHSAQVLNDALNELSVLIRLNDIGRAELDQMSHGLEILDKIFPKESEARLNLALPVALDLLSWDGVGTCSPGWRYLFSNRLKTAQGIEALLDAARKSAARTELGWKEANGGLDELNTLGGSAAADMAGDLLGKYINPFDFGLHIKRPPGRGERAKLKLLRIAAHWRLTGEILTLDDPFGDKIKARLKENLLRTWSVGWDGLDQGGIGRFDCRGGEDIVLEVGR